MDNISVEVEKEKKVVKLTVNSKIYSLDAIHDAALKFLDNTYIFLDGDPEKEVVITLKGKKELSEKKLKDLAGEFSNELINSNIRFRISKSNKLIREYIVSAALVGASKDLQDRIKKENANKVSSKEDGVGWDEDPLGIASSWEDRYEEKENKD